MTAIYNVFMEPLACVYDLPPELAFHGFMSVAGNWVPLVTREGSVPRSVGQAESSPGGWAGNPLPSSFFLAEVSFPPGAGTVLQWGKQPLAMLPSHTGVPARASNPASCSMLTGSSSRRLNCSWPNCSGSCYSRGTRMEFMALGFG